MSGHYPLSRPLDHSKEMTTCCVIIFNGSFILYQVHVETYRETASSPADQSAPHRRKILPHQPPMKKEGKIKTLLQCCCRRKSLEEKIPFEIASVFVTQSIQSIIHIKSNSKWQRNQVKRKEQRFSRPSAVNATL